MRGGITETIEGIIISKFYTNYSLLIQSPQGLYWQELTGETTQIIVPKYSYVVLKGPFETTTLEYPPEGVSWGAMIATCPGSTISTFASPPYDRSSGLVIFVYDNFEFETSNSYTTKP